MNSHEAHTGQAILPIDHRSGTEASPATASTTSGPGGWYALRAAAPGVGAALLLGAACPACWLAYAGLLTVPGLVWLLETTSLMLITLAVLGIALASLAYRA